MEQKIKPASIQLQLAVFGISGITIFLGTYFAVPVMIDQGIPLIISWTFWLIGPTFLNGCAVLFYYYRTERPDWKTFIKRFRLQRLTLKQALIIFPAAVLILILNDLLSFTIPLIENLPFYIPQSVRPELFENPYEKVESPLDLKTFFGVELIPENRWLILFWIFFIVFGIFGEEMAWRGYLLPRQEAGYGKYAWLVNGMFWNIPFHLYTWSNIFSDMPMYFIIPFLSQYFKNTWMAIVIHSIMLSLAFIIIVPKVIG
ncbi:MAG: CPBP family intramembrane metalloprotease [Spirochaetia bacterium]|nr:CPBP family intramembrane metalloprotease [Spirochaetia bacterium]